MSADREKDKTQQLIISHDDILFECPSCGKSLVVGADAEGMIISCPKCQTSIIVPPKPENAASAPQPEQAHPAESGPTKAEEKSPAPQERMQVLAGQLKEMQMQRTEISSRIASRLNDVNRDLVLLARLETSQQQILSELNQLMEKTESTQTESGSDSTPPVVLGSSVNPAGRTRVSFRQ